MSVTQQHTANLFSTIQLQLFLGKKFFLLIPSSDWMRTWETLWTSNQRMTLEAPNPKQATVELHQTDKQWTQGPVQCWGGDGRMRIGLSQCTGHTKVIYMFILWYFISIQISKSIKKGSGSLMHFYRILENRHRWTAGHSCGEREDWPWVVFCVYRCTGVQVIRCTGVQV